MRSQSTQNYRRCRLFVLISLPVLIAACASFGPYHANTADQPFNSVRGPKDGRYKLAFIEFGDQGSPLDNSQRKAALEVIRQTELPLLFVYIHGWQNNAESGDIGRPQTRKGNMLSRTQPGPGNETYRFSTTHTLSDFPLLIGEMLRRNDLRSEKRARRKSRIRKITGMFAIR